VAFLKGPSSNFTSVMPKGMALNVTTSGPPVFMVSVLWEQVTAKETMAMDIRNKEAVFFMGRFIISGFY
jgi:hypothetical protein